MTPFTKENMDEVFQDVSVQDKFNFRFYKEGDEWVCRLPEWLLKEAQEVLK